MVAAVVERLQPDFFCKTYLSGATQALGGALIVQTAQKVVSGGQTDKLSHKPNA